MEDTGVQKKSFLKAGIVEIIIILVLVVVIVTILSYLKVIPLNNLLKLGIKPSAKNTELTANTVKPKPVAIQCPVDFTYCKEGITINYNGNPALVYTVPKNYTIFSPAKLIDFKTDEATISGTVAKTIRASFISDNNCYTATYTMPGPNGFKAVSVAPIAKGAPLGFAPDITLSSGGQNFNLMVQFQARSLDPDTKKKDLERCALTNQAQAGSFIQVASSMFN